MLGILYESNEWSDWKLAQELKTLLGADAVCMINMEDEDALSQAALCTVLVSRVFASACFRGHRHSHQVMETLFVDERTKNIPLINPAQAHRFEIDKCLATKTLKGAGIAVPKIIVLGTPSEILDNNSEDQLPLEQWPYPCIIKPNCGGRTTCTAVLHSANEARSFLQTAPEYKFIVENYIEPTKGFLTRVEVVDGEIALIVKRSVAQNGLSSYHEGSTYELYPDCSSAVINAVLEASHVLDIQFGSFDVIENIEGNFTIDANSVSNVSEDCTEIFNLDLMAVYARALAKRYRAYSADC